MEIWVEVHFLPLNSLCKFWTLFYVRNWTRCLLKCLSGPKILKPQEKWEDIARDESDFGDTHQKKYKCAVWREGTGL